MSALLTALSLLGTAYGTYKSAQENKSTDAMLSDRMNDIQSRFDRDINTNILDTEQGKSFLKLLNKNYEARTKALDSRGAITGASTESKVAAKGRAQDAYDTALTNFAGMDTQRKDSLRKERNWQENSIWNQQFMNQLSKGQNWMNLMNNFANVGTSGTLVDGGGPFSNSMWFK